ncbi:ATP-binding cassette domain-containing protein [Pseudomonas viridiflava]
MARRSRGPRSGRKRDLCGAGGLNLQVYPGRTLAIVGESGSGKNTGLRIDLGLENPSRGRGWFEQQDVTE